MRKSEKHTPAKFGRRVDQWPVSKLGKHVKIYSGVSPSELALNESGKYPFVKVEDLNNCKKYQEASRFYTNEKKGFAPANSVIFPKRGAAIMNNKIRIAVIDMTMDTNLMAVMPNGDLDTEYFYYAIEKEGLFRIADTSTIPQLNNKHINPYELPIPPLKEQRKIAEILRTWDHAIEAISRIIEVRERQQLALTHQLVFGQRRLGNFEHSQGWKKHQWFDLPSGWQVAPIGKLAKEVSERNGDRIGTEVLSCSKYDGFVRSLEYFKKQVFSGDLTGYKLIWRGDFGFPSNHIEEGSIGLQDVIDVGLVSPIYTIFRFDPNKIDNDYAIRVLKTSLYRHIFEVSTSASVDRRGSLRWKEFAKIEFPLPPLAEQRTINALLAESQGLIDRLKKEKDALTRQKRGLMQKLLTGEWRVKVDSEKEAAA